MTKEDIIKKHCYIDSRDNVEASIVDVENAMDEYTKQQAIAFLEFTALNGWELYDREMNWINRKNEVKTSSQLYSQFIESQQTKDNESNTSRSLQ